jgi:hypothetical protein
MRTGTKMNEGTHHALDLMHTTEIEAGTLAGTVNFNLVTVSSDNEPVGGIIVNNAVPVGVTLGPAVNQPNGSTIGLYLPNPGINTWGVTGFKWRTPPPVWEAGKDCYYQMKRMGSHFLLAGSIEGGNPVTAGGGNTTLPAPADGGGAEVIWGVAGSEQTFMRGFTGVMATGPGPGDPVDTGLVTDIGTAFTGDMSEVVSTRQGIDPQNGQSFHVPYAHPDGAANNVGVFVSNTKVAKMTAGTTKRSPVSGTPILFKIWLEYTKES